MATSWRTLSTTTHKEHGAMLRHAIDKPPEACASGPDADHSGVKRVSREAIEGTLVALCQKKQQGALSTRERVLLLECFVATGRQEAAQAWSQILKKDYEAFDLQSLLAIERLDTLLGEHFPAILMPSPRHPAN